MPVLFQTQPGRVVRLDDAAAQCRAELLKVGEDEDTDGQIDFTEQASIVTRMTISEQVNVQFLHTLGAQIFIYVFGDRIGQISLSGLSFACGCDDLASLNHGAELMYDWYKTNRTSKRELPLRLMLGDTPIEGFVTGFTEDVVDASTKLVQWGVTMMTLPDED